MAIFAGTTIISAMKRLLTGLALTACAAAFAANPDYSFRDTTLPDSVRVERVLRQLTLDEKIGLLSTNLGVERLGIARCGTVEGLHGLSLGSPGSQRPEMNRPTTIFPQAYGLGESWDTTLVRRVAEQAATEARYYSQHPRSVRQSLVQFAPNADLGRDPAGAAPRSASARTRA